MEMLFSHRRHPRQFLLHSLQHLLPWLGVLLLVGVIIIPAGLLVWFIFFTDTFVVRGVTVIDARPHTTTAVRELIATRIERAPVGRNIFFVPTDAIEADIIASVPQVRSAHVTRKLPDTIKTIIQEKTPALLFLSNGNYYFVDDAGIAYEEARLETLPGTVLPIVKNSDLAGNVTLGVPVVSQSFVSFAHYLQQHLPESTPARVAEIRIPSLSAREVHFRLDNNWELRFDVTRDPAAQLAVLKQLLHMTITPEEQAVLDYIDLRIANRVYYKTRGATPSNP